MLHVRVLTAAQFGQTPSHSCLIDRGMKLLPHNTGRARTRRRSRRRRARRASTATTCARSARTRSPCRGQRLSGPREPPRYVPLTLENSNNPQAPYAPVEHKHLGPTYAQACQWCFGGARFLEQHRRILMSTVMQASAKAPAAAPQKPAKAGKQVQPGATPLAYSLCIQSLRTDKPTPALLTRSQKHRFLDVAICHSPS